MKVSNFTYYFIPTVTMLEGVLYLFLAIWGLSVRACSQVTTDIQNKTFQFITDLLYMQEQNCGNPKVIVPGVSEPVTLELDWPPTQLKKHRTYLILLHYTVYSFVWIVFSFILMYTIKRWPNKWILLFYCKAIWAMSVIDIVATGFFGYDLSHTSSPDEFFDYLGLQTNEPTLNYLKSFGAQFTTPAIVMTVLSSRGAVLWLFNVIGSIYYYFIIKKTIPVTPKVKSNIPTNAVIPVVVVIEKEPPRTDSFKSIDEKIIYQ